MKKLNIKGLAIANFILIFIFIMVILSACTLKKKIAKAKKVAYENPIEFAEFCANLFPVKEVYVKGKDSIIERTLTVKGDSIPCPIVQGKITYVKCPDAKVIYRDVYRTDTIVKENTARLTDLNNKIAILDSSLKTIKETASKRLWWLISLFIVLGGSLYFNFRK